jgi:hypothetical protein
MLRNLLNAELVQLARSQRRVKALRAAFQLRKKLDRDRKKHPGRVLVTCAIANPPRKALPKMMGGR